MWEMTNVQDVVAPNDNYPLSQGVLFQNTNCPVFIALNTGDKNTTIGNNGKLTNGGTIWDSGITIARPFNKMIAISYNGANGPFIYGGNNAGLNPVEECSKANTGITFKYGMGLLENQVMGIDGAYGTNHGRVPGDMTKNATYVDFNQKGHKSSQYDFHFEMSIPLNKLGVTANDVANRGIGVLLMATMGLSPLDCLPYDLTCNDNANKPDTKSQENNSFEKSDQDNFTVPFAFIGHAGNDNVTAGIHSTIAPAEHLVNVYTLSGQIVKRGVKAQGCLDGLSKGIYIVNGKKVIR